MRPKRTNTIVVSNNKEEPPIGTTKKVINNNRKAPIDLPEYLYNKRVPSHLSEYLYNKVNARTIDSINYTLFLTTNMVGTLTPFTERLQ